MVRLKIFVASPGDVGEERRIAARVIERLQFEQGGRVVLEPIFWEHEPLRASASFQEEIPRPSESDIVVSILWSRLGTMLPGHLTRDDGSRYGSGTEFEIEDALRGFRQSGTPDLLVYRKTAKPLAELDDESKLLERLEQRKALDGFIDRWFRDAEGSFTASFHDFGGPAVFEDYLESHLRKLIEGRLEHIPGGVDGEPPLWQKGSPFRGLESFDFEHAPVFCGRTAEIGELLDALRRQAATGRPFVLVLGMSGCGKSSLVRAGLLPELTFPNVIEGIGLWRRAELIPGTITDGDLFDGLARALLGDPTSDDMALGELRLAGTSATELAALLRERPASAVPLIRSGLSQAAQRVQRDEGLAQEPVARLALLVDQLEELFTVERFSKEEITGFDCALAQLVASGAVWLVATLRSDFYGRASELPQLMALKEGAGQYDLRPPDARAVGQIIRQPARMAGLRFQEDPATGERLDDLLRDAAAEDPAALPLLEFTLEELFRRRSEAGLLTLEAYRALNGVEGALALRAEEVFAGLPTEARSALPRILPALVSWSLEEADGFTRRRAPLASLAAVPGGREVVDAFVAARLLAADHGADGTPVVSVAHEALLRRWPRAQRWIEENAALLRTSAQLKSLAALWRGRGESEDYLIRDAGLLAEAAELVDGGLAVLGEDEARLVAASRAAAAERHKRRTLRRAAIAAGAVLVLAATWLYLDFYRFEHRAFFTALARRDGVPVGVGELSGGDVKGRQWSLEVIRRGRRGPVVRVAAVNGRGEPTPYHLLGSVVSGYDLDDVIADKECVWELTYDGDGGLASQRSRSCFGRTLKEVDYVVSGAGDVVTGTYVEDGIAAAQTESGVAVIKTRRDARGRDVEQWYLDRSGEPRPNHTGAFGMRFEALNPAGQPGRIVHLGPDRQPAADKEGCTSLRLEYDEHGRGVAIACLDPDDRPTPSQFGWARTESSYDEVGNLVRWRLYDVEDRPVSALAEVRLSYDERGNLVEEAYYDAAGEATFGLLGSAGLRRTFDERGIAVETTFLDGDGEPTVGVGGVAGYRYDYDENGDLVTVTSLDPEGQPSRDARGAAVLERVFDEQGHELRTAFFDEEGAPTPIRLGYAKVSRRYDRGRVTEISYFDADGKAVCGAEQAEDGVERFARKSIERDARGNPVGETLRDETGVPLVGGSGYSGVRRVIGASGETLAVSYVDVEGKPLNTHAAHARWTARYNSRNLPEVKEFFDESGQVVRRTRYAYDARGFPSEESYFDAGDRLQAQANGVARVRVRNNSKGQPFETAYFDADGRPTIVNGHAVLRHEYDFFGRLVAESYLDAARNPTTNDAGIGRIEWAYDRVGNPPVRQTYYDAFGDRRAGPLGFAELRAEYDRRGRIVKHLYLDAGGDPVTASGFPAAVAYEYDDLGFETGRSFLDAGGAPASGLFGCASLRLASDHLGNPIELECLDEGRRRQASAMGFTRLRIRRSGCGLPLEVALYDAGGGLAETFAVGEGFDVFVPDLWAESRGAPRRPAPPPRPTTRQASTRAPSAPQTKPSASPPQRVAPPPPRAAPPPAAPVAGSQDLGEAVRRLESLGGRLEDQYDDFVDRQDRKRGKEEKRLDDLFDSFGDEAEEVADAYRKATGGGLFNRIGMRTGGPARAAESLKRRLRELQRLRIEIDRLRQRYAIGDRTTATWTEAVRHLDRLRRELG